MSSDVTVLVTGFGPFDEHRVNASWEAVRLLPQLGAEGVQVVVEEMPVVYSHIDQHVPLLWEKYKPKLVVHVGVSSLANVLTIETQAFRTGYSRQDCIGNTHRSGEVCPIDDGKDCIRSNLDVDQICDVLSDRTNIKVCKSSSAGRYLCEFIYYKSLNIDRNRTLFIHVPPLNKPYSAEELAEGLLVVIKAALQQLCGCDDQHAVF